MAAGGHLTGGGIPFFKCRAGFPALILQRPENWPYREILETIWTRADRRPDEIVEYASVVTALEFRDPPIVISKQQLIECCKGIQVMAPNMIFARANTVELYRRPDLVLEDIHAALGDYPEDERRTIVI